MNMIGHDHKFVNSNIWKMSWYIPEMLNTSFACARIQKFHGTVKTRSGRSAVPYNLT